MPAIDAESLRKALDRAPMTAKQLTERLQAAGYPISHDYVVNIIHGHRKLKRNAVLRRLIAEALDVPVHWIEVERPDPELQVRR